METKGYTVDLTDESQSKSYIGAGHDPKEGTFRVDFGIMREDWVTFIFPSINHAKIYFGQLWTILSHTAIQDDTEECPQRH